MIFLGHQDFMTNELKHWKYLKVIDVMVIPLCPKTPTDPILGTIMEHVDMLAYMGLLAGPNTNGCPLGISKFILLSDNLNICLWLSACQAEKIIN